MRTRLLTLVVLSMAACGQPMLPEGKPAVVEAEPWHCSTQTCAGCCVGDVCRDGDTKLACGSEGTACRSCADGERCVVGGRCELDDGSVPVSGPPDTTLNTEDRVLKRQTCVIKNGSRICY